MRWLLSKNSYHTGILVQPFNHFNYYTHKKNPNHHQQKQNQKSSTPFATWDDCCLWLPTSPACFHSEGMVKRKVRSWSLLAEAELLHRKGKFMETERNIKGYTTEKAAVETWSLLAAWISHLCGMVQRYSCTYCWALGNSLLSILWFCLFFWSAQFQTEVLGHLIKILRLLLYCFPSAVLAAHEQNYYTARKQTETTLVDVTKQYAMRWNK